MTLFYFSKNTKNIAFLREHLYYAGTLNARKLFKISYNSMTYYCYDDGHIGTCDDCLCNYRQFVVDTQWIS